jgi:hypothetical protein
MDEINDYFRPEKALEAVLCFPDPPLGSLVIGYALCGTIIRRAKYKVLIFKVATSR